MANRNLHVLLIVFLIMGHNSLGFGKRFQECAQIEEDFRKLPFLSWAPGLPGVTVRRVERRGASAKCVCAQAGGELQDKRNVPPSTQLHTQLTLLKKTDA